MRIALIVGLASILAAGCYLSHRREPTRDAAADGEIAARDAGSRAPCVARCDGMEVIATLEVGTTHVEALLGVAAIGSQVGVLIRDYTMYGEGLWKYYALVPIESSLRRIGERVAAVDMPTDHTLTIGGIHADGDAFHVAALRTERGGRFATRPTLAAATWSLDGTLAAQHPDLGFLPTAIDSCLCEHEGAAFGRRSQSAIAFMNGETLWLSRIHHEAPPRADPAFVLATFDGAPPRTTPLAGAMLSDGRVVVAGGGTSGGLDPRDGFIVVEQPSGAPVIAALRGERYDPPPHVVVVDDRIFDFRFVSSPSDLAASAIVAEERDEAARVTSSIEVSTPSGLVPGAMAAFGAPFGGGLVWIDPSGDLHVVPTGWARPECPSFDSEGAGSLAGGPARWPYDYGGVPLLALGSSDGARVGDRDVLVVALADEANAELRLIHVRNCRVEATR